MSTDDSSPLSSDPSEEEEEEGEEEAFFVAAGFLPGEPAGEVCLVLSSLSLSDELSSDSVLSCGVSLRPLAGGEVRLYSSGPPRDRMEIFLEPIACFDGSLGDRRAGSRRLLNSCCEECG